MLITKGFYEGEWDYSLFSKTSFSFSLEQIPSISELPAWEKVQIFVLISWRGFGNVTLT